MINENRLIIEGYDAKYEEDEWADVCYECQGYGDDYYYDEELDELVCCCDTCAFNEANWEDGYWIGK